MCRTASMSAKVDPCPMGAGESITLVFKESEGTSGRAIEEEHNGPCLVYMAPAESNGEGEVWFKIFEEGYHENDDSWCIKTLNDNDGKLEVTIPADLAPGDYLMRGEIIAMHNIDDAPGPEFYPNCLKLTVSGTGTAVPKGVAIPGEYAKPEYDSTFEFNIYDNKNTEFVIPGPPVYEAGTSP
ncbi:hypothetical protein GGI07_003409, partial [Coemansia sp. Benny D115]